MLHEKGNDMGMNREDAYYEPEDDHDNSDEFDYEVSKLMHTGGDHCPSDYDNFAEAIQEAKYGDRVSIEDMLYDSSNINFEALGRKLFAMAYDYMEKRAVSEVQDGY